MTIKILLDSGASDHVTNQMSLLENIRRVENKVLGLGDSEYDINYIGDMKLFIPFSYNNNRIHYFMLYNVLYIPQHNFTIISSNKLCKDNQLIQVINEKHTIIYSAKTKKPLTIPIPHMNNLCKLTVIAEIQLDENKISELKEENKIKREIFITRSDRKNKIENITHVHELMNHTALSTLQKIKLYDTVKNFPMNLQFNHNEVCLDCSIAKLTTKKEKVGKEHTNKNILYLDLIGPLPVSYTGNQYILSSVHGNTNFRMGIPIKHKNDVTQYLEPLVHYINNVGLEKWKIKFILFDNGKEFDNNEIKEILNRLNLSTIVSTPYYHEHNSKGERTNLEIADKLQKVLTVTKLNIRLWDIILPEIINNINMTSLKKNEKEKIVSSFELHTGMKPNFEDFNKIGQVIIYRNDDKKQRKFTSNGKIGILLCGNTFYKDKIKLGITILDFQDNTIRQVNQYKTTNIVYKDLLDKKENTKSIELLNNNDNSILKNIDNYREDEDNDVTMLSTKDIYDNSTQKLQNQIKKKVSFNDEKHEQIIDSMNINANKHMLKNLKIDNKEYGNNLENNIINLKRKNLSQEIDSNSVENKKTSEEIIDNQIITDDEIIINKDTDINKSTDDESKIVNKNDNNTMKTIMETQNNNITIDNFIDEQLNTETIKENENIDMNQKINDINKSTIDKQRYNDNINKITDENNNNNKLTDIEAYNENQNNTSKTSEITPENIKEKNSTETKETFDNTNTMINESSNFEEQSESIIDSEYLSDNDDYLTAKEYESEVNSDNDIISESEDEEQTIIKELPNTINREDMIDKQENSVPEIVKLLNKYPRVINKRKLIQIYNKPEKKQRITSERPDDETETNRNRHKRKRKIIYKNPIELITQNEIPEIQEQETSNERNAEHDYNITVKELNKQEFIENINKEDGIKIQEMIKENKKKNFAKWLNDKIGKFDKNHKYQMKIRKNNRNYKNKNRVVYLIDGNLIYDSEQIKQDVLSLTLNLEELKLLLDFDPLINTTPKNITKRPDREYFRLAAQEEIQALKNLDIIRDTELTETNILETYGNMVNSQFVYKVKNNFDGTVTYRSRLVCGGHKQIFGQDYIDSSSNTTLLQSLNMFMSIIKMKNFIYQAYDIEKAYLHSKPSKFEQETLRFIKIDKQVYELQGNLYGTKLAGANFLEDFQKYMISLNYTNSQEEEFIFKDDENGIIIYSYVDDFLIAAKDEKDIAKAIKKINKKFKLKNSSDDKNIIKFLGCKIIKEKELIKIDVTNYSKEIVEEYKNEISKRSIDTPMSQYIDDDDMIYLENITKYQQLLGKLSHLSRIRYDIQFAVIYHSKYNQAPTEKNYESLLKIVQYLNSHTEFYIEVRPIHDNSLKIYVDASYATDKERKNYTGIAILWDQNVLFTKSITQRLISNSSTHAEIIGIQKAIQYAYYFKRLFIFFKIKIKIEILNDNTSAITNIFSDSNKLVRYIDLPLKWIRQEIRRHRYDLIYVASDKNKADIFTKAFNGKQFQKRLNMLKPDNKKKMLINYIIGLYMISSDDMIENNEKTF